MGKQACSSTISSNKAAGRSMVNLEKWREKPRDAMITQQLRINTDVDTSSVEQQ